MSRPLIKLTSEQLANAISLIEAGGKYASVAEQFGIAGPTLFAHVKRARLKTNGPLFGAAAVRAPVLAPPTPALKPAGPPAHKPKPAPSPDRWPREKMWDALYRKRCKLCLYDVSGWTVAEMEALEAEEWETTDPILIEEARKVAAGEPEDEETTEKTPGRNC